MNELDSLSDKEGLGRWIESAAHIKLKEHLALALKAMRGRKREVFVLFTQGKSQDEISTILGISRSAVQIYFKRGVKEIRKLCEE